MPQRFRNTLRELEWFTVIAVILLVAAVSLVLWAPGAFEIAVILVGCAIVSAIFSYRT